MRNRSIAALTAFCALGQDFAARFAKITMSAVVGAASGKAGGVVFSKGRGGAIVRIKRSPAQPHSNSQQGVRASFTSFSQAWSATVTAPARQAWIALAANHPVKDIFGQTVVLTGLQLYQALNRALATLGLARIDTPPLTLSAEFPGILTLVATVTGPVLTVLPATFNTAAMGWSILVTRPLSAGVSVGGARFAVIKTGTSVLAAAQSFHTEYAAKFGEIVQGQKIFVRMVYINKTTGAIGTPAQSSVIVAA
jgi:hypothetical protein